ncbi:MAG: hypothetical protein ABDH28_06945 [Brevinematia bacterium]
MKVIITLTLAFVILLNSSCKQKDEDISKIVSEVEKKQTELEEVGVPKFLLEEQKLLETNTNQDVLPQTNVDEFLGIKDKPLIAKSNQQQPTPTHKVSQEIKYPEITNLEEITEKPKKVAPATKLEKEQKLPIEVEPAKLEEKVIPEKKPKYKPLHREVKVYFSYKNGKRYIDTNNPGKITAVVYVGEKVWYVDYSVYAIPYKNRAKYRKYLSSKYLIGIGRNISVVDNRSQLTVYWRGSNIYRRFLPNGKYMIVVKTTFKDSRKRVISSFVKHLGKPNPIIVILAN